MKKYDAFEGRYYIKSSLKENSKKTIPKTNCSNLYSNFDQTHIKKSSSKEESIREGCKFSSFYTYRESSNKNVSRFEESFIYNPKEVKLKAKSIIDKFFWNKFLQVFEIFKIFIKKMLSEKKREWDRRYWKKIKFIREREKNPRTSRNYLPVERWNH